MNESIRAYAACLATLGHRVFEFDGVIWYEYNGFLRPVGLPHAIPNISSDLARAARAHARLPFVRWESDLERRDKTGWWFVTRRGDYSIEQLSSNSRSKVRRGGRRLQARRASADEIAEQGERVCASAVERFGREGFLPGREAFARKLEAARCHPESFEFFGVFDGESLVGFSENHVQENGVFWESIWYAPEALKNYSGYLMTHAMLDHYLNERGFEYVTDGARIIYHQSNIHDFLISKFNFAKEYCALNVDYSSGFGMAVSMTWPMRRPFTWLAGHLHWDILQKVAGILRQEEVRRANAR